MRSQVGPETGMDRIKDGYASALTRDIGAEILSEGKKIQERRDYKTCIGIFIYELLWVLDANEICPLQCRNREFFLLRI